MNGEDVTIRVAGLADAQAISSLISQVAQEVLLTGSSEEQRAYFLRLVSPSAIAEHMGRNARYHVAVHNGRIVGVIAVRDNMHVRDLWVADDYQYRGLGTQLWEHAKRSCLAHGNLGHYTLNATTNALGFYQRLGFASTGPPVITQEGITTTPMERVSLLYSLGRLVYRNCWFVVLVWGAALLTGLAACFVRAAQRPGSGRVKRLLGVDLKNAHSFAKLRKRSEYLRKVAGFR